MLLSQPAIERLITTGHITIDEFKPENLGSAQYDVTLGENFYRERTRGALVYNPYDEAHVRDRWIPSEVITHREWLDSPIYGAAHMKRLANIGLDEKLIILDPGEMILAHTEEFIGGSCDFITTKMYARSSSGRNGIEVCRCAGLGDVGYFTRWTMEIVNTSRFDRIVLVPGRRVAQLVFELVERVDPEYVYSKQGKYQDSDALETLKSSWKPDDMLPKQWLDRESRAVREAESK